jgi:hypothetical protein
LPARSARDWSKWIGWTMTAVKKALHCKNRQHLVFGFLPNLD